MLRILLAALALASLCLTATVPALAGESEIQHAPDRDRSLEPPATGQLYIELGEGVVASEVGVTVDGAVVALVRGAPIELGYGTHEVRVVHGGIAFAETLQIGEEPRAIRVGAAPADPTGTLTVHVEGVDPGELVVKLDGEVVDPREPIRRALGRYTLSLYYRGKVFTREVEFSERPADIHVGRSLASQPGAQAVEDVMVAETPAEAEELTRGEKAKAQAKKGSLLLAGGVVTAGLGVLGVWLAMEGIEQGNSDAPKALVGSATLTVMGAGSAVWGAGLLITSPVRLVTGKNSYVSPYVGPSSLGVHGVF